MDPSSVGSDSTQVFGKIHGQYVGSPFQKQRLDGLPRHGVWDSGGLRHELDVQGDGDRTVAHEGAGRLHPGLSDNSAIGL